MNNSKNNTSSGASSGVHLSGVNKLILPPQQLSNANRSSARFLIFPTFFPSLLGLFQTLTYICLNIKLPHIVFLMSSSTSASYYLSSHTSEKFNNPQMVCLIYLSHLHLGTLWCFLSWFISW